jgi:hypothetical protein
MGINDKDYANALEHQRLHERALMQLELEKQKKENSLMNTIGSYNTTIGTSSPTIAGRITLENIHQPYGQFKALTEQDLKHEGMRAPLSALVDMWTVRWGGEWVSETEFQEDDFWRIALVRLTGANKLEKHNLANQYMSVYRIIE